MSNKTFRIIYASRVICLSMFIVISAHAELPVTTPAQSLSGGSAVLDDCEIMCGTGRLTVEVEGNLVGVVDVLDSKISFYGKQARLGYCGCPAPGTISSMENTDEGSINGDVVPFIAAPKDCTFHV